jgi:lysophospholipase L1-like esterase
MRNKKQIIQICVITIYCLLLIFHISLLVLGRSWVGTTLIFYSSIAIIIVLLIKKIFFKNKLSNTSTNKLKTIKYSIYSTFVIIILLDLGLRYFTPKYRSYSEKNYGCFYISPFTNGFRNLKTFLLYGNNESEIKSYPANTSITYKTENFIIVHEYNELGLRERKNLKELTNNKRIILTIGDSFTEGVGTHQDSTWQRFLEDKLHQSGFDNYIVINAGISDSEPFTELKLYEALQKEFKPDITILSIGSGDMLDVILKNPEEHYNYLTAQPFQYYFYSWSYIFRAFSFVVYDNPEIFMNQQKFYGELVTAEDIINKQINKLKEKQISQNGKTFVFVFPDYNESISLHYKFKVFEQLIDKLKLQNDIYVYDMLDYHRSAPKTSKDFIKNYYWATDGHMTVSGYKLWADLLYDKLIDSEYLEGNGNK